VADVYPGGFRDFERAEKTSATAAVNNHKTATVRERPPPKTAEKNGKEEKPRAVAEDEAKKKYEDQRNAARTLEKKQRRIKELETSIATGEKDLDALRAKLKVSPGDDWEKLAKMAQEEQSLAKRVDSMLIEWARLSEEVSV
jgi:predicted  nucleic acid-binding Zn-ribbon protein